MGPRCQRGCHRQYGLAEIGHLQVMRVLTRLDESQTEGLRQVLDTPNPDEDIFFAADTWLSTLAEQETRARQLISLLEDMLRKQ